MGINSFFADSLVLLVDVALAGAVWFLESLGERLGMTLETFPFLLLVFEGLLATALLPLRFVELLVELDVDTIARFTLFGRFDAAARVWVGLSLDVPGGRCRLLTTEE